LNSTVNERRCRARFCSTFSMMDILSRDKPLILDVRQNGSGPTSIAFVAAGAGILVASRRSGAQCDTLVRDSRTVFALLVAGIGVGSFIQHGPHPDWQAYAHDLPLAAVLVFLATEAASDLTRHELSRAGGSFPR
jgi:hypothetical protein